MKVPEDLARAFCEHENRSEIVDVLRDWFAAHELVDLSLCGPQCPACVSMQTKMWPESEADFADFCHGQHDGVGRYLKAPTGQPCPVLAQRKEQG